MSAYSPTLHRLRRVRPKPVAAKVRRCRVCGCTDLDCRQCIERTGRPCSWVPDGGDLCSACAYTRPRFEAALAALQRQSQLATDMLKAMLPPGEHRVAPRARSRSLRDEMKRMHQAMREHSPECAAIMWLVRDGRSGKQLPDLTMEDLRRHSVFF